jgi:hypothetical protein
MRWRALIVAAGAAALVIGVATPAAAKGADQVTITGPGLAKPIVFNGTSEPGTGGLDGGEALGRLADGSGLFTFMFGVDSSSGTRLSAAPAGDLGPKFGLNYRIPDDSPSGSTFHQDLYPAAAGGPVTFTPAGQKVFGTDAAGGWFQPQSSFKSLLIEIGIPGLTTAASTRAPAPKTSSSSGGGSGWLVGGSIGGAVLIAFALVVVATRVRRRIAARA